ncbi:MAG TPA: hypothetical protein VN231_15035 [Allosphingosinicella sp.]|nr:hypothetical protein [Allosphingosinicella sp.]
MRLLPAALTIFGLLAGCAGNVADYVGPRTSIVAPQLVRYGMNETESQCVSQRLAISLTPLQLRRFTRLAGSVRQGFFDPERLTVRDLLHVAGSMNDPQIRLELARATEGCGVVADPAAAAAAPPATPEPSAPRAPAWLNLGAAPTGQAIAVDASSLEQDASIRKAWFRLTNPNEPAPTGVSYLLRIDCAGRTIEALAHRVQDEAGAVTEHREYAVDTQGPLPIEGGTVMEIAYLALCT